MKKAILTVGDEKIEVPFIQEKNSITFFDPDRPDDKEHAMVLTMTDEEFPFAAKPE